MNRIIYRASTAAIGALVLALPMAGLRAAAGEPPPVTAPEVSPLPAAPAGTPPATQPDTAPPAGTPPASTLPPATPPATTPPPTGQGDPLAAFYGNTLILRDGGIVSHFYYNADHTFRASVPAYFMQFSGKWSVDPATGDVCRIFDVPPPTMSNPDCGPMRVHAVGDKVTDANGDVQQLVAGIR